MVVIDWHTFGDRVHLARRRLKLSQEELAKRTGMSRNYVSMIERGIADPGYTIVVSLCAYLGIQPPPDQTANVAMNVAKPHESGEIAHPDAET